MRLFAQSLKSGSYSGEIPDVSSFVLALTAGLDGGGDSFMWFIKPYLASDYPEISGVTKTYFWIYSSHHIAYGSSWGQGNNLDMSDFEEMGYMNMSGHSDEAPTLFRVPASESYNGNEMLAIMYHPSDMPQQSRMYVNINTGVSSLSLTSMQTNGDWTYVNNLSGIGYATDKILGLHTLANGNQLGGLDEAHTGYAVIRKRGVNDYEAKHSAVNSGVPLVIYRYSYSTNGYNWVRGDDTANKQRDADFIVINGVDWFVGSFNYFTVNNGGNYTVATLRINALAEENRPVAIVKYDSDWRNPYVYYYLSIDNGVCYSFKNGNTLLFYSVDTRIIPNHLVYFTLDIQNIDNWNVPDNTNIEPPSGVNSVNVYNWVKALDTQSPTIGILSVANVTTNTAELTCSATDNDQVIGFQLFLGQNTPTDTYWKSIYLPDLNNTLLTGLYTGRDYYLKLKSVDKIGNLSTFSNIVNFQTL